MRGLALVIMVLCGLSLGAQLRVTPVKGAAHRGLQAGAVLGSQEQWWTAALPDLPIRDSAHHPATYRNELPSARTQPPSFDFSRTAPHLAFFCRLEINEARGGAIPLRFRLGGHTYWQDRL